MPAKKAVRGVCWTKNRRANAPLCDRIDTRVRAADPSLTADQSGVAEMAMKKPNERAPEYRCALFLFPIMIPLTSPGKAAVLCVNQHHLHHRVGLSISNHRYDETTLG
ncbi:MAG TPA: hypothetical protein DEP84_11955 [Chloroflexi bacterium]|nr:hypothetical protein [Chloroflexota bacterium]